MDHIETLLDTTRGNTLGAVIHSLRAVSLDSVRAITDEAARRNLQIHLHLEEQRKEIDDCLKAHGMRPLDLLIETIPREQLQRFVAVHCTHSELNSLTRYLLFISG